MVASPYRIERDRGAKESQQQFAVLQEKWPLAFPARRKDTRPLAIGATREIAAAMGWSLPYTLGVLGHWKMAPAYCKAILSHDQRVTLEGAPAEAVDAAAKELAAKQLARLAARKARKNSGKVAAPPIVEANAVAASVSGTPDQLRDEVRASLVRPSA